jgi:hypothetical protein
MKEAGFANNFQSMRQTIAYGHFWETTREVMRAYRSPNIMTEIESKAKSLIDINLEGHLLREVKDILDELHIMLDIKSIQQRILKQYRKHVEYLLAPKLFRDPADPEARWSSELGINLAAVLDDRVTDLKALKDSGERTETAVSLCPVQKGIFYS